MVDGRPAVPLAASLIAAWSFSMSATTFRTSIRMLWARAHPSHRAERLRRLVGEFGVGVDQGGRHIGRPSHSPPSAVLAYPRERCQRQACRIRSTRRRCACALRRSRSRRTRHTARCGAARRRGHRVSRGRWSFCVSCRFRRCSAYPRFTSSSGSVTASGGRRSSALLPLVPIPPARFRAGGGRSRPGSSTLSTFDRSWIPMLLFLQCLPVATSASPGSRTAAPLPRSLRRSRRRCSAGRLSVRQRLLIRRRSFCDRRRCFNRSARRAADARVPQSDAVGFAGRRRRRSTSRSFDLESFDRSADPARSFRACARSSGRRPASSSGTSAVFRRGPVGWCIVDAASIVSGWEIPNSRAPCVSDVARPVPMPVLQAPRALAPSLIARPAVLTDASGVVFRECDSRLTGVVTERAEWTADMGCSRSKKIRAEGTLNLVFKRPRQGSL